MTETSTVPAVKAPPDDDLSITELVEFDPTRLDGVKSGATGIGFLIMKAAAGTSAPPAEVQPEGKPPWHATAAALARMGAKAGDVDPAVLFKAVNAAGEVDEAPDIDGGKQAIALIAKLIGYEAAELEAGCLDETCDIGLLLEAASALRCWLAGEQGGSMADGTDEMAGKSLKVPIGFTSGEDFEANFGELSALLVAGEPLTKDSRTFTAAERKKHAADGTALPDGSYPIPDKDALRRAAILARSGHGDVKAAKRLIARRAKELGVPNPLDEDDKASSSAKAAVAEEATTVDTEAIEAAVAKALAPSEERITALEGKLAKAEADLGEMAARPVHGGPVLSAAAHYGAPKAETGDWAAKAANYRRQAEEVSDRQTADGYRQLAREADEKARALTPPA